MDRLTSWAVLDPVAGRPDFRRGPVIRINERIRVPQVRVTTDEGEQFGVMDTREAIRLARERSMDLVEVAPYVRPPVCRVMDYKKFKAEQRKQQTQSAKQHEQKRRNKENGNGDGNRLSGLN